MHKEPLIIFSALICQGYDLSCNYYVVVTASGQHMLTERQVAVMITISSFETGKVGGTAGGGGALGGGREAER